MVTKIEFPVYDPKHNQYYDEHAFYKLKKVMQELVNCCQNPKEISDQEVLESIDARRYSPDPSVR